MWLDQCGDNALSCERMMGTLHVKGNDTFFRSFFFLGLRYVWFDFDKIALTEIHVCGKMLKEKIRIFRWLL